jgi:hypothetical protein
MIGSIGVTCFGSVEHALGVAALGIGELDRAVEHLRAAVDHNLALGHAPAAALSRDRLAEALARRGAGPRGEASRFASSTTGSDGATGHPADVAACFRAGRQWRVEVGDRAVTVQHGVGMLHLSVLLANPGREIAAADLAAGVAALGQPSEQDDGADRRPARRPALRRGARDALPASSRQPVLDDAGIRRYRRRLAELGPEIDELELRGEAEEATRSRAEQRWLISELAGAVGLGGRVRNFSDENERARIAVGKAIRRALARIRDADPWIGAHLAASLHTGTLCWYLPPIAAGRSA